MESNYAGNMSIGNYRGTFDPTSSAHGGSVYLYLPIMTTRRRFEFSRIVFIL